MAGEFDLLNHGDTVESGFVNAVEAIDLHKVWVLCRDMQAQDRPSGKSRAVGLFGLQAVCGPGADAHSVWYRASLLLMLSRRADVLMPWTHDGELDQAVFRVAAVFPMGKMPVGVVRDGMPFDVEEFLRQVEAEAQK